MMERDQPVGPATPLAAFTSHVFHAAQAIEALRLALELSDDDLAVLASARLRTALAAVEHARDQLPPVDLDEALALASHLEHRASQVLATAPTRLHGVGAIHRFLERFGSKP